MFIILFDVYLIDKSNKQELHFFIFLFYFFTIDKGNWQKLQIALTCIVLPFCI